MADGRRQRLIPLIFFPSIKSLNKSHLNGKKPPSCYPTALRRAQITPKTSTKITRYLYSRGPVKQVLSLRKRRIRLKLQKNGGQFKLFY